MNEITSHLQSLKAATWRLVSLCRQSACVGSATGEVYLWQFGKSGAVAGFTPLPATSKDPPAAHASLFSSSARSWNTPGVSYSNWGQPQSVRTHSKLHSRKQEYKAWITQREMDADNKLGLTVAKFYVI